MTGTTGATTAIEKPVINTTKVAKRCPLQI